VFHLLKFNHACLFLVVKVENAADTVFGLNFTGIRAYDINKLFEGKLLVGLPEGGDDVDDVGVASV
jgi:hypothetical protein